jgi:uncharacterized membrane protein YoaK (UPF0700 family)
MSFAAPTRFLTPRRHFVGVQKSNNPCKTCGLRDVQGETGPMSSRRRSYFQYLHLASAHRRAEANDEVLAAVLAFVAGAVNAGGFFAVGQYTSHMTGVVSALADNLALGAIAVAAQLVMMLAAFTAGAAASAVLINWARRADPGRQYALPLALEGVLILTFGALGVAASDAAVFLTAGAVLLCFILGLQNATITKISGSRMRTTHLTGMVTDIGIELGKALFAATSKPSAVQPVVPDWDKFWLLTRIVGLFFLGGLSGALAFAVAGFWFAVPLAGMLFMLSVPRIVAAGDD